MKNVILYLKTVYQRNAWIQNILKKPDLLKSSDSSNESWYLCSFHHEIVRLNLLLVNIVLVTIPSAIVKGAEFYLFVYQVSKQEH